MINLQSTRSRTRIARWLLLITLPVGLTAGALEMAVARVPGYETLRQVRAGLASDPAIVMNVGDSSIEIVFANGATGLDRKKALDWIKGSAESVSAYFGRFPVKKVSILIVAEDGNKVGRATAWGYGGSTIRIAVGRDADKAAYDRDWVMVHEMVHLALPGLPEQNLWALEGSATYAESIARAQLGKIPEEKVWGDMLRGLPQGLPEPGDRGLDRTPTWGRTYWGGSLFYLIADIRIREATGNAKGLQDAFRAINAASLGNESQWTMDRMVAVGDKATGTDVLANLYAEMKDQPVEVDIDALFAKLGVEERNGVVRFNENAPLSGIRRAITQRKL
jgi:hypothetical protein